jgi:uncharacterized protein (DUF983 family)
MKVIKAFLAQKCPRCHQGNMFIGNTYSFSFGKPKPNCSHCGLKYDVEPGFFTGAMYFSYGINVAIIVVVGVSLNIFFTLDIYTVIGIVLACVFAAVPFSFRYSRMLMMYLFSGIGFDEKYGKD